MQKHSQIKQIPVKFTIGNDNMEIIVEYDMRYTEYYAVIFAYHNGTDVTEFYRFCEQQKECLFYPQIVEGIAREECGRRIENYVPLAFDPFKGNGTAYKRA